MKLLRIIYNKLNFYINMTMQIIDSDSTTYQNKDHDELSANYLKSIVNGKEIDLPSPCASKSDYDNSEIAKIPLETKIFQHYVNMITLKKGGIQNTANQATITRDFNDLKSKYNPLISDINFWNDGRTWTENERKTALNLELTLDIDFLSDVVLDKQNITARAFETQINSLLNDYETDRQKCPTISLGTPLDVFNQQLKLISKYKFKRFNVDWAGITTAYPTWQSLTEFLKENQIWCNMTSVNQRRQGNSMRSNMMIGFVHGVHTCGFGFPAIPPSVQTEPESYLINRDSYRYETDERAHQVSDTISHNRIFERVFESHTHIQNDTYYDNFIPEEFLRFG